MKHRSNLYIIILVLLHASRGMAQPPSVSYPSYLLLTKDSAITVAPVNKGGIIPSKVYGETNTITKGVDIAFNRPADIAVDAMGNLYVSDEKNNRIRRISTDGTVSTVLINNTKNSLNGPSGIAVDANGIIYVTDTYHHLIRKILPSGELVTIAGNGQPGDKDDDNGLLAMFRFPVSIAVDTAGNIFVSDEGNNKIRKISAKGAVTTFAGTGAIGSTDHANGKMASFHQPNGIALDASGNVFVSDQLNHKIRKINPSGAVTTYAGNGVAGSVNHNLALQASFNNPRGIAVDNAGNVYVADAGNQQIRMLLPKGGVTTLAGSGAAGSADNKNGLLASFYLPNGLTIDNNGKLYVADCLNDRIRMIETNGYEIEPNELPGGLHFDHRTGILSGTPVEITPGSNYLVRAHNQKGTSGAQLGIAVSDQPGNALDVDGFDDKVTIPDNPTLTADIITTEMWVRPKSKSNTVRFLVKRNSLSSYDDSYSVGMDKEGHFGAVMASGVEVKGSQAFATDLDTFTVGRWYFLSAVFSKDSIKLYVNGQLKASCPSGFPISRGVNALYIAFDGFVPFAIDEVRVFNTDRSKELMQDMINTLSPSTPGLVAYYNCNIGRAGGDNRAYTALHDLTSNNNHGTLQNFLGLSGDASNWVESYAMVVPDARQAAEIGNRGFTAKWNAPKLGVVDNYFLDVSEDPSFRNFVGEYHEYSLTATEKNITGLKPGTRYYYRVRANKHSVEGQGAWSSIITVKTN